MMSKITIKRETNETTIELSLTLLGEGNSKIQTGIGFFDHMLELFAFHAQFDIVIEAKGDTRVDDHHTIEDVGIVLGSAFNQALNKLKERGRYGVAYVPMDESLARTVIDLSNRSSLVFRASFERERIGMMDTQNVKEFLTAFVREARMNLHTEVLYGENDHHKIEAIFKSLGRSLKQAIRDENISALSTKGIL